MEVLSRRGEVEQLFTLLISQYWKPGHLMKYLDRKFQTEGSNYSKSIILTWKVYCHRPREGPSIAMGGTTFPCRLSGLHWLSLFCSQAWHKHVLPWRGWEAALHPCWDASAPQPAPSLGLPGTGALSPAVGRQWDLVCSPIRAILEPKAGTRNSRSPPRALLRGPHCSPRGIPLCLGCGAQLKHEHTHCWQSAATQSFCFHWTQLINLQHWLLFTIYLPLI